MLPADEFRYQAAMARRLSAGLTVADVARMEAFAVECDAAAVSADLAAAALTPLLQP